MIDQPTPQNTTAPQANLPSDGKGSGGVVSSYMKGSVSNMLRSLLAIGAVMALFVIVAPRLQPDHSGVDVQQTAEQVAQTAGLEVSAPQDLGEEWVETRAEYRMSTDDLMTWHAGFETPAGEFVALNETQDATPAWVATQVNQAPLVGESEIAGAQWQRYAREGSRIQRSFVRLGADGELTTVVTGNASWDELSEFVAALEPVSAG
mgnify:CR=1 FL=1